MAETGVVEVQMPQMGESVTEGTILEWHVEEGQEVSEGDTVVEVSTDKIDAEVPAQLDVQVVCDNYGTHKTPAVNTWLARHPRFHVHFTPTSSSWVNQVERWFAYITDELIRRGSHASVQALEADIRAWVDAWNNDPKPFVWTKTAEQILQSIHRLMKRINGAGH